MRRIAVYGKGGIGKSTVSSNLTAALSDLGTRVLQIGCDPKHDSTRGLTGGASGTTVLDYLRDTPPAERTLGGVVSSGYGGSLCVEAGGPEPGVGCAGRGIITTFDFLKESGAEDLDADLVLYDVLGDVVCGGFAVPLRKGYADTVYIVTSGEFMAIYAANNILRGTSNYDPDRIGGLIFNSRGDPEEESRVARFSEAVGIPVVARIPRSDLFMDAEKRGSTVVEAFPDSELAGMFRDLARLVLEGDRRTARFLPEDELEKVVLGRSRSGGAARPRPAVPIEGRRPAPYASVITDSRAPLGGCAFSGASSTCTSIEGLTTVLHSPRSCAHFTIQLDGLSAIGPARRSRAAVPAYLDPDVVCTDMREDDMVFGGGDRLRRVLERKAAEGRRDMAVVTSCPPGMIGDDVAGICADIEREHPGVSVALLREDGNAAGDFMQGVVDACTGLVGRFSVRGKRRPLSVNLVGAKTMSSTVVRDLEQITSILESIGVEVNCVLPGVEDLDRIRRVPDADANLRISPDLFTDRICAFLEDRFGMETLPVPVAGGMSGTRRWVECVASRFGREDEGRAAMDDLERRYRAMAEHVRPLLEGRTAAVVTLCSDADWVMEALDASGMEMVKGYMLARADYSVDLDQGRRTPGFERVTSADGARVAREIADVRPDAVLSVFQMDLDPSLLQVRIPVAPDVDPFAGAGIMDSIARGMVATEEGWRKDVARIRSARELHRRDRGIRGDLRRFHRHPRAHRMQVLSVVFVGGGVSEEGRPPSA